MNHIIVSFNLVVIVSITFIKTDKRLQAQFLWNTTQSPYRFHGYRYNVPYYKHNNTKTITTIENNTNNHNNDFRRYMDTNNKNSTLVVQDGKYGFNYKTTNTSNNFVMVTSTTENYKNIWGFNGKLQGQSLKSSIRNETGGTLGVIVVVDDVTNETSTGCDYGCSSEWTPLPGISYKTNHTSYDNSGLVRLKSFMSNRNQTKDLWMNEDQNTSFMNNRIISNNMKEYNKTANVHDDIQMYPPYQTINYDEEINQSRDVMSPGVLSMNRTDLIDYRRPVSDSLASGSYYKTLNDESRKLYPDRSYYYSDYDYHKWYYNDRFSDSWGWFKEQQYCKKHCHCCKEQENHDEGVFGNLIHFIRNLNTGYDFFNGRSIIDDYNPLSYIVNLYRRFSDDSFVYFDHDHDHSEPDHVVDCQDLCSCCHTEVVVKLKKKLRASKWKQAHALRLLGLIRVLKHLFTDEDDCGDDCYEDWDDRSFDDPGRYDHFDDVYDHTYEHAEEPDIYLPHSHPHHYSDETDHHYFDCSKCCKYCKKTTIKLIKEHGKKRHRKWHRKKLHKKGLWKIIKHLLHHKILGISFEDEDDDDHHKDKHNHWTQPQCCNDMSGVKVLVVVVVVAIIIIQSFSSVNILIVVIIPIVFFGVIIILIFLLLQAIIPIYFIPIIAIVLIIIAAPILLILPLLLLVLPIVLLPVFIPFILPLNGTFLIPNITCNRLTNLPVNCTIGNANLYQVQDTTEDYEISTVMEVVDATTVEYDVDPTEAVITREEQLEVPDTIYSKIKSALSSTFCLERLGCHMAVYTRFLGFYNEFILRILENLSVPINESKFVSYKRAYQIGSLNDTDHEKCTVLYYCDRSGSLVIKN